MNAIAHSATPGSTRNGSRSETVRKPSPNEPHLAFAVPGDLATPTGGYGYDRRINKELREFGWQVDVADIGEGFPFPATAERALGLPILSGVPRRLSGCPRWTCVRGAARGWRAPISHAAHRT